MKRETTLVRRRNGYLSRDCHAQERAERAARHLVNQLPLEIPGLPDQGIGASVMSVMSVVRPVCFISPYF